MPPTADDPRWAAPLHEATTLEQQVLCITGKGGVGKSTTVLRLAQTFAATGDATLIVEADGRSGVAAAVARDEEREPVPFDYAPRRLASGPWAMAIDTTDAVFEYLRLYYGIRGVQRLFARSHALDFVTAFAPGLRDLLLIGKIYELAQQTTDEGSRRWDRVVIDGPPSGQIGELLGTSEVVEDLARLGPIGKQAASISRLIHDRTRFAAVIVTQLEDMILTEARETTDELVNDEIEIAAMVANRSGGVTPDPDKLRAVATADRAELTEAIELVAGRMPSLASDDAEEAVRNVAIWAADDATRDGDLQRAWFEWWSGPTFAVDENTGEFTPLRHTNTSTRGDNTADSGSLVDRLASDKVVVVMGAGGVGKTTVSAAIALALAESGRRTLVLTIDPARRLATALGVGALSHEPVQLDIGENRVLWGSMLDARATFDDVIRSEAASDDQADRILDNRIYDAISSRLAGSVEFMALERIAQLREDDRWDVVVVDTPPARFATDLLDAPSRLADFFQGRLFRFFAGSAGATSRATSRLVASTARRFARIADRVAGASLLAEIAGFMGAFDHVADGIVARASIVDELLADDAAGFVVVTTPEVTPLEQAAAVIERLRDQNRPVNATIVNRMPMDPLEPVGIDTPEANDDGARVHPGVAQGVATETALRIALHDQAVARLSRVALVDPVLVDESWPSHSTVEILDEVAKAFNGR